MANTYKYVKESVARRRKWVDSLKTGPCEKCGGEFPPYVMDFHHRDRAEKLFGIGGGSFTRSKQRLIDEIAKCALLCSNCHRIVEYELRLPT